MKYEYWTSYFLIDYDTETQEYGLGARFETYTPQLDSLVDNPKYKEHLKTMGEKGWELISVQPVLYGMCNEDSNMSYGLTLTSGYYFFWRRAINE